MQLTLLPKFLSHTLLPVISAWSLTKVEVCHFSGYNQIYIKLYFVPHQKWHH